MATRVVFAYVVAMGDGRYHQHDQQTVTLPPVESLRDLLDVLAIVSVSVHRPPVMLQT